MFQGQSESWYGFFCTAAVLFGTVLYIFSIVFLLPRVFSFSVPLLSPASSLSHSSRVGGHSCRVSGHSSRVGGHISSVGGHSSRVRGHSSRVRGHSWILRVGPYFPHGVYEFCTTVEVGMDVVVSFLRSLLTVQNDGSGILSVIPIALSGLWSCEKNEFTAFVVSCARDFRRRSTFYDEDLGEVVDLSEHGTWANADLCEIIQDLVDALFPLQAMSDGHEERFATLEAVRNTAKGGP